MPTEIMNKILIFCLFVFSNLLFAQDVTKVITVDKPIKYVYRVMLESLNKCGAPTFTNFAQYMGAYYDDNETASVTMVGNFGMGDAYKLKKLDNKKTEISYYKDTCLPCTIAKAEAKLAKTVKWINDGEADCQFAESAPSQPKLTN